MEHNRCSMLKFSEVCSTFSPLFATHVLFSKTMARMRWCMFVLTCNIIFTWQWGLKINSLLWSVTHKLWNQMVWNHLVDMNWIFWLLMFQVHIWEPVPRWTCWGFKLQPTLMMESSLLCVLVRCAGSRPAYFADRLNLAMKVNAFLGLIYPLQSPEQGLCNPYTNKWLQIEMAFCITCV